MRRAWKQDIRRRKTKRKGPAMLAREKWQVRTIAVLERVFEERCRQVRLHGHNEDIEDGTGPDVEWLMPYDTARAEDVQKLFREDYEAYKAQAANGKPTWMHIIREEIAEALELHGDDPEFLVEIIQVAAVCVNWAEKKIGDPRKALA
jgi:hypothetical protein